MTDAPNANPTALTDMNISDFFVSLEKRLAAIEQRLTTVERITPGYTNIIDTRVTEDKIRNSGTFPQIGLGNAIGNSGAR